MPICTYFHFYPFGIPVTEGIITQNDLIPYKFINWISKVKMDNTTGGCENTVSGKEAFLRIRILFMCNLGGAIARENSYMQLKPCQITSDFA